MNPPQPDPRVPNKLHRKDRQKSWYTKNNSCYWSHKQLTQVAACYCLLAQMFEFIFLTVECKVSCASNHSRLAASHRRSLHVDATTDQGLQGEDPTGRRQRDHRGARRGCDGARAHPRGGLIPVLGVCHGLLWYRLWGVLWVDGRHLRFGQRARVRIQRWRRRWRR